MMSKVKIILVETKKQLKEFVKFPFALYADCPHWVPPMIADEMETFNPKKNPSYDYAEAKLWLAYVENEIVGRIAAIKHGIEFKEYKKIRFGWIDFVDDNKVSSALLSTVENWAIEQNAIEVHGPMGFTDMDFEGMLIEGFDSLSTIATIYNFPYYQSHLEDFRYNKSAEWVELKAEVPQVIPEKFKRTSEYICSRFNLKVAQLKNSKQIKNYGKKMFQTLNDSFSELYGFHKLTSKESDNYISQYLSFVSPKYISFVIDEDDEVVGFGITMPSLSRAYQKTKGNLFPFGFIHLLKALKKNDDVDMYLIGINPKQQNTGVANVIFYELWKSYLKEGIKTVHTNPLLESNEKMLKLWKHFGGEDKIIKRRRCYSKKIA
jgi:ribosomal protein S18 acetylase RimI-like enzyme